jgi:hypothetical protein
MDPIQPNAMIQYKTRYMVYCIISLVVTQVLDSQFSSLKSPLVTFQEERIMSTDYNLICTDSFFPQRTATSLIGHNSSYKIE